MFTISSNRINLNFGPRNFNFGDMQVQSWHFVQNYTQKFSLIFLYKMPTLNLRISKVKVPRSKIQIDSIRTNREHYFNDLN